jgi:hypothetical protein
MRIQLRDPGIFSTLDPGSGEKNSDPGSTYRLRNSGDIGCIGVLYRTVLVPYIGI